MKRVNYHLTEQLHKKLKAQSAREGICVADIIRRALDAWFKKAENKA